MKRAKSFLYLLSLLFLVWLGFTVTFQWQELTIGAIIAFGLAILLFKTYVKLGLPPLGVKRLLFSLIYILIVFKEIIKANIDVAYRAIHPQVPINPGIVIINTDLEQDVAKMILANSITLTPGTFTLDIIGDKLLIHWINVETESVDEATEIIGERFERYLRVIFG